MWVTGSHMTATGNLVYFSRSHVPLSRVRAYQSPQPLVRSPPLQSSQRRAPKLLHLHRALTPELLQSTVPVGSWPMRLLPALHQPPFVTVMMNGASPPLGQYSTPRSRLHTVYCSSLSSFRSPAGPSLHPPSFYRVNSANKLPTGPPIQRKAFGD